MKKSIIPLILVLGIIGVLAVSFIVDSPASATPISVVDVVDGSGYGTEPCASDIGDVEIPGMEETIENILFEWQDNDVDWEEVNSLEDCMEYVESTLIPSLEEDPDILSLLTIADDIDTHIDYHESCDLSDIIYQNMFYDITGNVWPQGVNITSISPDLKYQYTHPDTGEKWVRVFIGTCDYYVGPIDIPCRLDPTDPNFVSCTME